MDAQEIDPVFSEMERLVGDEADAERAVANSHIESLKRVERVTRWLTPTVFVIGLILVGLLALATRGYRRLLDAERARALHFSLHDALTGLPNWAMMADYLDRLLGEGSRSKSTTGLLLIDLDRFREVNDTFGHHYGDELLAQIGPRLRAHVREGDIIARLGGDEFAVLLPDVGDRATAVVVADALQHALDVPFQVEGVALDIEASIGIVLSGQHGGDASYFAATRRHCDVCGQGAKPGLLCVRPRGGRPFTRPPRTSGRTAACHGEPRAFPALPTPGEHRTGEVMGAEALVRWHHPTRGIVYPDDFVPLAERTGMIGPLTECVLNAAVIQAKVWFDAGQPLPVAVNLSVRNLADEDLPRQVAVLLKAHQLSASLLKLEVTESAIMFDPDGAARVLRQLADLGVEISIDDFGAGYTSLGQLKSLPVTEFKIDKSFVMNMNEDDSDALIVNSVVDLGHNLGLTIVAEGVENDTALEQLAAYGCDAAQGYHLCRPVSADAFDAWRSDYEAGLRVGAASTSGLETTVI